MRSISGRFTIRSLMIAVAVSAGLLALPVRWGVFSLQLGILALALSPPVLAVLYAGWLHANGHLRIAGRFFWISAIATNVLYVTSCAFPGFHVVMLVAAWFLYALPTLGGFGMAWATLTEGGGGGHQATTSRAWLAVIALTMIPLATAWTAWPSYLRFLMARPALERLADRVAAGQAVTSPQRAGSFWIAGSRFDPTSGNVGLMIDTDPNGPTGFIRNRAPRPWGEPFACYRPFLGDWYHLDLVGGWCYHEED